MGNTQLRGRSKKNGFIQVSWVDGKDGTEEALNKKLDKYHNHPSFVKLSFIDFAGTKVVQEFYEVFKHKPLGKGSFGEVWLAQSRHQQGDGKEKMVYRAIKQLKKPDCKDKTAVLKKEVEIIRLLRHPGMIRCFETFEDRTYIYLVLDYCRGGTLQDRMANVDGKGNWAPESTAARWLKEIMGGVGYLHKLKIVHRDIKPDNFLFKTKDPNSPLLMIDFGLAERFDQCRLTEPVGTPYYVAPEVLKMMEEGRRSREYTEACDIWSIGVIGFQMFTKMRPFEGSVKEIFHQILNRSMTSVFKQHNWENNSFEAKDLLTLLMNRNPTKRLSAEESSKHPFFVLRHPPSEDPSEAGGGSTTLQNLITATYEVSEDQAGIDHFEGGLDENGKPNQRTSDHPSTSPCSPILPVHLDGKHIIQSISEKNQKLDSAKKQAADGAGGAGIDRPRLTMVPGTKFNF